MRPVARTGFSTHRYHDAHWSSSQLKEENSVPEWAYNDAAEEWRVALSGMAKQETKSSQIKISYGSIVLFT